jgi:mono/diheme cytochrome c family protein
MWHVLTLAIAAYAGAPGATAADESFAAAAPILSQHCVRCHNGETTRGGLDLTTRSALLQGGATRDAMVPHRPADSPLWQRSHDGSMPPEKDGRHLRPDETAALARWIEQGAAWPDEVTLPWAEPPAALVPVRLQPPAARPPVITGAATSSKSSGSLRRRGGVRRWRRRDG